jgi:prevent-host-death family protein
MTTKTIDATDLRNNMSDALDTVKAGEMLIVKRRGKDEVAIIDIDLFEDYLAAQDPEYLKSIAEARASKERFTPEEVFGELWNEA